MGSIEEKLLRIQSMALSDMMEGKAIIRRVRTPAGILRYGQGKDTIIVADAVERAIEIARGGTGGGRRKPKAPVASAAPSVPRNANPPGGHKSPVNARGGPRGGGKRPKGLNPPPGFPAGSWSAEEMDEKIAQDKKNGFPRKWIRNEADLKAAADAMDDAFGEGTSKRMLAEWNRKDEDGNRINGHVVVPENHNTYKGTDLYQIQRLNGSVLNRTGKIEMKWQAAPIPGVRAESSAKNYEKIASSEAVEALASLRESIKRDLEVDPKLRPGSLEYKRAKANQLSAAASLMGLITGMRPNSQSSAQDGPLDPVGFTNIRIRHIIKNHPNTGNVTLRFLPGKASTDKNAPGGKEEIELSLKNKELSSLLSQWTVGRGPDEYVFAREGGARVSYANVNDYVKKATGGKLTAKNLRTSLATGLAYAELSKIMSSKDYQTPTNQREMAALIRQASEPVSKEIGHADASMTFNNYISPQVWFSTGITDPGMYPKTIASVIKNLKNVPKAG